MKTTAVKFNEYLEGSGRFVAFGALLVIALLFRIPFLDSTTGDTTVFVVPWYEHMRAEGFGALAAAAPNLRGDLGGNYSPPYYYLLWAVSALDGLAPKLWLVKSISFAFDLLAAFFAYRLVKLHFSPLSAFIAAAAVLICPSTLANSAWWGQVDMMWTSMILGSLYCAMSGRPAASAILFGIGLSLKAQAFFFAPFLFMLLVSREMKIWHLALAPAAFVAMLLPAIIAGRNPIDALTVYLQQAEFFSKLSMNAPNLYLFAPDSAYAVGLVASLVLTAVGCFVLAILPRLRGITFGPRERMLAATMFVAIVPFLLPKMHDRYFFAADIFAILLVFYWPRLWFVPLLLQAASLAAYTPIITWSLSGMTSMWVAPLPLGGVLNAVTVSFLVYLYWRTCWRNGEGMSTAIRQFGIAAASMIVAIAAWLGLTEALALVQAQICPGTGLGAIVCNQSLSANLMQATVADWLLFVTVVITAYAVVRFWITPLLDDRATKPASV
ncbi:MAG: DUF2029 domain-containing protein [Alphaproteobacteria bacterium]|jgi:Gpi18-like mannosyltransferase|nr:MAG: DUF2029 domain-containing protein [Alphaproteobacteria bacterium]